MDAIQEVAVQTSNFNAEYGNAAGGYFNYTMKSGTNTVPWQRLRLFCERRFWTPVRPLPTGASKTAPTAGRRETEQHIRNRIRRNDYGFTFGGPVEIPKLYNGKNKSFFFFNFEQFRQGNLTGTTTDHCPDGGLPAGQLSVPLSASPTLAGPSAVVAVPVFPGRQ